MKKKNYQYLKGFTLLELLVVISIIGVLAGVVLVSFTGSQKQARNAIRKSDLKQYQTLLAEFASKNKGFYPQHTVKVEITDLCNDIGLDTCINDPRNQTRTYRYITSDGSSPPGSATATEYAVWIKLEDAEEWWVVCSNGRIGKTTYGPFTVVTLPFCPV